MRPAASVIMGNSSCCSRMTGDIADRNSTASISWRALRRAFSMRSRVMGSRAVSGARRGRAPRDAAGAAAAAADPRRSGATAGRDRAAAPFPFGEPRAEVAGAPFPAAVRSRRGVGASRTVAPDPLPFDGARFPASSKSRSNSSRLDRSISSSEVVRPDSCDLSIFALPVSRPPGSLPGRSASPARPADRAAPESGAVAHAMSLIDIGRPSSFHRVRGVAFQRHASPPLPGHAVRLPGW